MFYDFPIIRYIDDVLPYIKDDPNFIVVKKDDYIVIQYVTMGNDTFPKVEDIGTAIRRECRGLIFDKDGFLIARRFQKFFNINEREETLFGNVDFEKHPHIFLEKLDGSMVSPIPVNVVREEGELISYDVRWGTKMGITDTSLEAEVFVAKHPEYQTYAEWAIDNNLTAIFEWCSNKNRIILSFPEDKLILTGLRHNMTGAYIPYDAMSFMAHSLGIPVVKAIQIISPNLDGNFIDTISKWEDQEGVVVRFENGHMLKVKTEWYVLRHRSKDAITRERNVLEYIINNQVDDVKPFLIAEDRDRLDSFATKFWFNVHRIAANFAADFESYSLQCENRKAFAERVTKHPKSSSIFFTMYDGKPAKEALLISIKKCLSSQKKIDENRHLWGDIRWDYNYEH